MIRANIQEAEEQTMARFMSGLNYPIKRVTEFQPYNTVVELVHQATKAERQVQQDSRNTRSYPTFTPKATTYSSKSTSRATPEKSYTQGSGGGTSSLWAPSTTTSTKAERQVQQDSRCEGCIASSIPRVLLHLSLRLGSLVH